MVALTQKEMKRLLSTEYREDRGEDEFDRCCSHIQPCSQDIAKIADDIDKLAKQRPQQYVSRVAEMEEAIVDKCHEIKK